MHARANASRLRFGIGVRGRPHFQDRNVDRPDETFPERIEMPCRARRGHHPSPGYLHAPEDWDERIADSLLTSLPMIKASHSFKITNQAE